ncbi:MbcA/ParS/Xre antitoxin family protein [Sphingomonas sp. BAUL-RG-20F-R05-02]|uniref:MbcA/ParS/Xre antitoxin family protein n=1 Tax=Sphingomonas sp. BAUL-RG-20F-R05-02 TaxID=2914830 RepID=UPI001F590401|nr:MbcA/ParS/Xre antitoxin family protein [Sphingomonas sp. BAUL-RG-20F-R05-02]
MVDNCPPRLKASLACWENVREHWELSAIEEADLLGGGGLAGPAGEAASWCAFRLERRMQLLIELAVGLDALLGDEARIQAWLRRSSRAMGGQCPIQVMSSSETWICGMLRAVAVFET